jgi:hypothetical protein
MVTVRAHFAGNSAPVSSSSVSQSKRFGGRLKALVSKVHVDQVS